MHNLELIRDLGVTLLTALVMGMVARSLRMPLLLGYLVGGIVVGPYTLGWVPRIENVSVLSELGVTLLMFVLGVEFSLAELDRLRNVAIWGGLIQMGLSGVCCALIFWLLGWDRWSIITMSACVAISSTMIVIKTLMERGEHDSVHGRVALTLLIVQDLAVVALLAVLPVLPQLAGGNIQELAVQAVKAGAYLVSAIVLARRGIPWLMERVAAGGSKELFMLTSVALAFAAALGTQALGFSLALGAFVAGLILSETEYNHEVLGNVIPLRDTFTTLFFASVGMLIEPRVFIENAALVGILVASIVVVKFLATAVAVVTFRYHPRTAFLVGLSMVQVGEFSFVMARQSVDLHMMEPHLYAVLLSAAVISILLTPALIAAGPAVYVWVARTAGWSFIRQLADSSLESTDTHHEVSMVDHVIVIGYGRTGRFVAESLVKEGHRCLVVDYELSALQPLRDKSMPFVYGDASNELVMNSAHPDKARLAIVALPDLFSSLAAVRALRRLNPDLDIVASAHYPDEIDRLYEAGAQEVIYPPFEAGLEIIRYTLLHSGHPLEEVQAYVDGIRARKPTPRSRPDAVPNDHYIVCGAGRLGQRICDELKGAGIEHYAIEIDPARVQAAASRGIKVMWGDATSPRVLERAGLKRARGVVVVTPSDINNLYIVATVRGMRPDIVIVAGCSTEEEESKFRAVGADRVFAQTTLSGKAIAHALTRPEAVHYLEAAMRLGHQEPEMHEVPLKDGTPLAGHTLAQSHIRRLTGATVVAVRRGSGEMLMNPSPDYVLDVGDVLLGVGTPDQIEDLREMARTGLYDPEADTPEST